MLIALTMTLIIYLNMVLKILSTKLWLDLLHFFEGKSLLAYIVIVIIKFCWCFLVRFEKFIFVNCFFFRVVWSFHFAREMDRVGKTPISLLQEICMTHNFTHPVYQFVSCEGLPNECTFIFKVTVGELSAFGKEKSKKKAKQAAALAILMDIEQTSVNRNEPLTLEPKIDKIM